MDVPYRVPGKVRASAGVDVRVVVGARGIHTESIGGQVVVVGIEHQREVVGRQILVPPDETAADLRRLSIVEPGPHEKRVLADQDPHLGPLGDRLPLVGVALGELIGGRRLGPGGIVELPVHPDALGRRGRADHRSIFVPVRARRIRRLSEGGQRGEQENQEGSVREDSSHKDDCIIHRRKRNRT